MPTLNAVNVSFEAIDTTSKDFMAAVSGAHPDVARPPGLYITNSDLLKINRYVKMGAGLPTELSQVEHVLGYESILIDGLEPPQIQALYQAIKIHAGGWSSLESAMKAVGSDLIVFADDFTHTGTAITSYIRSLDGYKTSIGTLGSLTPEELENLPDIALGDGDKKRIPGLLALVDELRIAISSHRESASNVYVGIKRFKNQLKDSLLPAVGLKVALAATQQNDKETVRLVEEVVRVNRQIVEKLATYKTYSDYKWVGSWWGPLGLVISTSIYGPKASAVIAEHELLVAEKERYEREITRRSAVLSALVGFQSKLQDVQIRIEGAASSGANLESLWGLIEGYINSSYLKLKGITSTTLLLIFVLRLEAMMSSWGEIKKQANDLHNAFNAADAAN